MTRLEEIFQTNEIAALYSGVGELVDAAEIAEQKRTDLLKATTPEDDDHVETKRKKAAA